MKLCLAGKISVTTMGSITAILGHAITKSVHFLLPIKNYLEREMARNVNNLNRITRLRKVMKAACLLTLEAASEANTETTPRPTMRVIERPSKHSITHKIVFNLDLGSDAKLKGRRALTVFHSKN